MAARVGRGHSGHPGPVTARVEITARRRSSDAAGRPGRRVSEDHHEHEATCPMHAPKRAAAPPSRPAGGTRSQPKPKPDKPTGSPGPRPTAAPRRAAPAAAKAPPVKAAPLREKEPARRPSSETSRPGWNSSPPEITRRRCPGISHKRDSADKSPTRRGSSADKSPLRRSSNTENPSARRTSPPRKSVNGKPAPPGKSGIPKRQIAGTAAASANKPNKAKNAAGAGDASTKGRPDKARPASSVKAKGNVKQDETDRQKEKLSVPNDRPRAGSITGAGKSELGRFLEKLHLDEMSGSSDEEDDHNKSRLSIESTDTWRTGDGDPELMNTLRTKSRPKEPAISPTWKFADVIVNKKPGKDDEVTKPKLKNRFSFLVDSTDDDEPNVKPSNKKDANKDLSRFDDFVRESLSPERNMTDPLREKPEPVTERTFRPSTVAQRGSAPTRDTRPKDGGPRKDSGQGDGFRRTSYLDDLILPSAPAKETSPTSHGKEKRSKAPQVDPNVQPKPARPAVAPKPKSRPAESPRRQSVGNRRDSHSRTPSPEKSNDPRKRSNASGKDVTQKNTSAHNRRRLSVHDQEVKNAHQRRSRTPSPNTADVFERYHDVYPNDEKNPQPYSPQDWSNRRSSRYSRDSTSPSTRDHPSRRTSQQNGNTYSFSEKPKGDYYRPETAIQLREKRTDEQPDDKKVKRKSLSLAGMTNPERNAADEDRDSRLRRLIMSTEALEKRFFAP